MSQSELREMVARYLELAESSELALAELANDLVDSIEHGDPDGDLLPLFESTLTLPVRASVFILSERADVAAQHMAAVERFLSWGGDPNVEYYAGLAAWQAGSVDHGGVIATLLSKLGSPVPICLPAARLLAFGDLGQIESAIGSLDERTAGLLGPLLDEEIEPVQVTALMEDSDVAVARIGVAMAARTSHANPSLLSHAVVDERESVSAVARDLARFAPS